MYTQMHPQQMYELAQQRCSELVVASERARQRKQVMQAATKRPVKRWAKLGQLANAVGLGRRPHMQTAA